MILDSVLIEVDVEDEGAVVEAGGNFYAVGTEEFGLDFRSAESEFRCKTAETIDHSVTRDIFGIRIEMERISDGAGGARRTAKASDLSVSRHSAFRDFFDLVVD